MKISTATLAISALLFFSASSSFAQVRKIPATVTEAFKDRYPQASNVEWRDKLSAFVVVFEENNTKYEARFNSKGEWQNTEEEIDENALPEGVKEGFQKSKYAEWTIDAVHKIELPGDVVRYRVQAVKTDLQKKNLLFNGSGRLLKDRITL